MRIAPARVIVAFGHIHTEAGSPTLGVWSAECGLQHRFLGAHGAAIMMVQFEPIIDSFDIAQPPHRPIAPARVIVAFGHIHTEARSPTLGVWSAVCSTGFWVHTGPLS